MNTPSTAHPFVREFLWNADTLEGEEHGRCLAFARDVEEMLGTCHRSAALLMGEAGEPIPSVWANRAVELWAATLLGIAGWMLHMLLVE
jgi:hypothetical protein